MRALRFLILSYNEKEARFHMSFMEAVEQAGAIGGVCKIPDGNGKT